MREIKFRAWNSNGKKMFYNTYLYPGNMVVDEDDKVIGHLGIDVYLMQFTGLFDKNGKEIYEGDILNYCNKNKTLYIVRYGSYDCNSGYKYLAPQYIGASFYLEVVNQDLLIDRSPIHSYNDYAFPYPVTVVSENFKQYRKDWGLEVVGNIYKNPELLDQ